MIQRLKNNARINNGDGRQWGHPDLPPQKNG
jgi:hypothetical protein